LHRLALKLVLDQQHQNLYQHHENKTLYPEHHTLSKYQSLSKAGGERLEISNPVVDDPKPDVGYQNGRYALGYASIRTTSRSSRS